MNPYKLYQLALRSKTWRVPVIVLTCLYVISPFDIIPDFLPVIGVIDDGMILAILVSELVKISRGRKNKSKLKTIDK